MADKAGTSSGQELQETFDLADSPKSTASHTETPAGDDTQANLLSWIKLKKKKSFRALWQESQSAARAAEGSSLSTIGTKRHLSSELEESIPNKNRKKDLKTNREHSPLLSGHDSESDSTISDFPK
ncbi:UNVERIFIED_CONTAM: hypothetical protein K2H54_010416 [Gekko kuhli]